MYTGVSNLASHMQMARTNTQAKLAMNSAGQEVSSGRKSDLVKATGGDYGPLFAIERTLSQLDMRAQTIKAAGAKATASQLNMENIQNTLAGYGTSLLGAVGINNQSQAFSIASSARGALDRMVSSLNAQYAGQSLFAGAGVDGPAVVDAATMYADITSLTLAAPDSTTAIAAIDDYFFNPVGGFATSGFTGSTLDAPKAELADGEVVNYSLRGDDLAIRQALRNVALAAVAANGDHGGSVQDGMNMLKVAAEGAISTEDGLTGLREGLGHVEEQIDTAAARNTAESSAFEMNRNAILAADPYEAATRFQALEGQMQAIYTMTSRLSNMRLQNYLR
jgi:flagellar hook-associated protein 3 FlgL